MRDFSLAAYQVLLKAIQDSGYAIQSVEEYYANPPKRVVLLRHDVDSWPYNALKMAQVESDYKAVATYYFRITPMSFNDKVIRKIVELGHEIGYHYEDLASQGGNYQKAIESFQNNLSKFRNYYPVKTIAMHGRPLSRWDNLDLWKRYAFTDYGIIAEPYKSFDFNKLLYLTDTGSCWDGDKYSVRDFVESNYHYSLHSTFDVIEHLRAGKLPDQIMLNLHPSRWNDNLIKWLIRFYILTLPKYQIKKWLKLWRSRKR